MEWFAVGPVDERVVCPASLAADVANLRTPVHDVASVYDVGGETGRQQPRQFTVSKRFGCQIVLITGWHKKSHCCSKEGREEKFYLTTHSTHFIYGYIASDIMVKCHTDSERGNLLP